MIHVLVYSSIQLVIVFVIGTFFLTVCTLCKDKRLWFDIVKAIAYFFGLYVITSAVLLVLNLYTATIASSFVVLEAFIILIGFAIRYKGVVPLFKKAFGEKLILKLDVVCLILIIVGVVCASHFTQFTGVDSEFSGYQLGAYQLLQGNHGTAIQLSYGSAYKSYNVFSDSYILGEGSDQSGLGQFGGSPVVSTLYAFTGTVFGLEGMGVIGTVCFLLLAVYVSNIADKLKLKTAGKRIATGIVALCPLLVWTAQNSTPYIFIALAIAVGINELLEISENESNTSVAGNVSIFSLAFLVCSLLTIQAILFLPVVLGISIVLCLKNKKTGVRLISLIASLVSVISVFFYASENPAYLVSDWIKPLSGVESIWQVLIIFSTPAVCLLGSLLLLIKPVFNNIIENVSDKSISAFSAIFSLIALGITIERIVLVSFENDGFYQLFTTSFLSLCLLTGVICIPLIQFFAVFKGAVLRDSNSKLVLLVVFAYAVLGSTILRDNMTVGYESLAKMSPFILIVALLAASILQEKRWMKITISAVGLVMLLFTAKLAYADNSIISWSELNRYRNEISDVATIVSVSDSNSRALGLALTVDSDRTIQFNADIDDYESVGQSVFLIPEDNEDDLEAIQDDSTLLDSISYEENEASEDEFFMPFSMVFPQSNSGSIIMYYQTPVMEHGDSY